MYWTIRLAAVAILALVSAGGWIYHRMTGKQIACYLDGKKYLEATDDTFTRAGKIGLWTKADAQTWFDELKVRGK